MGLGKQAKTLTKAQVDAALNYLSNSRYPLRNRVILLLSVKAGLRAKEPETNSLTPVPGRETSMT
jgi:integrase/recombinase XerD